MFCGTLIYTGDRTERGVHTSHCNVHAWELQSIPCLQHDHIQVLSSWPKKITHSTALFKFYREKNFVLTYGPSVIPQKMRNNIHHTESIGHIRHFTKTIFFFIFYLLLTGQKYHSVISNIGLTLIWHGLQSSQQGFLHRFLHSSQ